MKTILLSWTLCGVLLAGCKGPDARLELARTIKQDTSLAQVDSMARAVIGQGLNAGSGYSQIWARDMNTFIETALKVTEPQVLREAILVFFTLQQPNDEMVDGYVLKPEFTWHDDTPYYAETAPEHVGFKNTVETDQETSLIQIVGKYIAATGDRSLLDEQINGRTVMQRMEAMVDYLMRERYDEKYGLLYGAMTSDWGDVQPGICFPCDFNECSFKAIDVYDNAMFIIALRHLETLISDEVSRKKYSTIRERIFANTRKHLWDEKKQKFIPHIYLEKMPVFPEGFDENQIHYHGGTAIAIEADLLTDEEIRTVNAQMLENVRLSGMPSIGLTLYPVYPEGVFKGRMSQAYNYQNGGDWTWFGGRMIQQLIAHGMVEEAYQEIRPMIDRVLVNQGFYEWYGMGNVPSGSGHFKGSAGVLAKAIDMLRTWAESER